MRTLGLALAISLSSVAYADQMTFDSGSGAIAIFETSGTNLIVTLENTGIFPDNGGGSAVLTALLFNVAGDPTLTPSTVELAAGSNIIQLGSNTHVLGDEWEYKAGFTAYHGATQGISSTGLNIFGPNGNFGCTTTCDNLDGPGWGLVGPDYGSTGHQGNPAISSTPLVQDALRFTLSGLGSSFSTITGITNVGFQYGTSTDEPFVPGTGEGSGGPGGVSAVPEPATFVLLGAGLCCLRLFRRSSASN